MREIKKIVVHCSASPNGRWIDVRDIDGWHRERGWMRDESWRERWNADLYSVGYHWVILLDGTRQTGRHPDETGAHVRGHNLSSLGICMIGMDAFTLAQWDALRQLIGELSREYPAAEVQGHRDLDPAKTCPGFDVQEWLDGGMMPMALSIHARQP